MNISIEEKCDIISVENKILDIGKEEEKKNRYYWLIKYLK